jgi:hypothetical protein
MDGCSRVAVFREKWHQRLPFLPPASLPSGFLSHRAFPFSSSGIERLENALDGQAAASPEQELGRKYQHGRHSKRDYGALLRFFGAGSARVLRTGPSYGFPQMAMRMSSRSNAASTSIVGSFGFRARGVVDLNGSMSVPTSGGRLDERPLKF